MLGHAGRNVHEDVNNGLDDLGMGWDDARLGPGRRGAAARTPPAEGVQDLGAEFRCEDIEQPVLAQGVEEEVDHLGRVGRVDVAVWVRPADQVPYKAEPLLLDCEVVVPGLAHRVGLCLAERREPCLR